MQLCCSEIYICIYLQHYPQKNCAILFTHCINYLFILFTIKSCPKKKKKNHKVESPSTVKRLVQVQVCPLLVSKWTAKRSSVRLISPGLWLVEEIHLQFCGQMKVIYSSQPLFAHSLPDAQSAQLHQGWHSWGKCQRSSGEPWQRDVWIVSHWHRPNTKMMLLFFSLNTSCLSEELLCQAVRRCQIQWLLALLVSEGAICPVVEQERQQLWVGQTCSNVQRQFSRHTVVHACTWRRERTKEAWRPHIT